MNPSLQLGMSETLIVVLACLMGAITYFTRVLPLALGEKLKLSPWLQKALQYAAAPALVALVIPELFYQNGVFNLSLSNPKWLAGLAAFAYWFWRPKMLEIMIVGMTIYTLLRINFP